MSICIFVILFFLFGFEIWFSEEGLGSEFRFGGKGRGGVSLLVKFFFYVLVIEGKCNSSAAIFKFFTGRGD